jgi:catechol 2,3-dioxygenase-like lactoylglutathione lyase family enzyme
MNETSESLRSLIRVAIAVLCCGALVLILLVLSGTGVDETTGKVIGTAVALAFFSLTGVAGGNLGDRRPELAFFGVLTQAISAAAFLVTTTTIWSGSFLGDDWRPAVYTGVVAFGCGHASVLVAGSDANDTDEIRLVRAGTLLALLLLIGATIADTASRGSHQGEIKIIAVVAILYILGTIVLGLLRRSTGQSTQSRRTQPPSAGLRGLRLDHLVIAVSDRAASTHFYGDVLGAELVAMPEERFAFRVGDQLLRIHDPARAAEPLAQDPVRPGNSDLCFVWPESIGAAVAHLQRLDIEIVAGPVVRVGAGGPGQSVYCRDPDGSLIELISYA